MSQLAPALPAITLANNSTNKDKGDNSMKYVVMVTIPFGLDDTYECEYSGIEHNSLSKAIFEKDRASKEQGVISARIERR